MEVSTWSCTADNLLKYFRFSTLFKGTLVPLYHVTKFSTSDLRALFSCCYTAVWRYFEVMFAGSALPLQVMKMVMTLNVQESGCVHFVKRPGAVLEAGCIVAHLELDDPSSLQPASSADPPLYFIWKTLTL